MHSSWDNLGTKTFQCVRLSVIIICLSFRSISVFRFFLAGVGWTEKQTVDSMSLIRLYHVLSWFSPFASIEFTQRTVLAIEGTTRTTLVLSMQVGFTASVRLPNESNARKLAIRAIYFVSLGQKRRLPSKGPVQLLGRNGHAKQYQV